MKDFGIYLPLDGAKLEKHFGRYADPHFMHLLKCMHLDTFTLLALLRLEMESQQLPRMYWDSACFSTMEFLIEREVIRVPQEWDLVARGNDGI